MGSLTLPTSGRVYVDAQVLIYSVEQHPAYAPLLQPFWSGVDLAAFDAVSSELVTLEALVAPIKNKNAQLIADYDQLFAKAGLQLIPVSRSILRSAAELRASSRLRTPDAIHFATAMKMQCDLFLTNDNGFRGLTGLPIQFLDDTLQP